MSTQESPTQETPHLRFVEEPQIESDIAQAVIHEAHEAIQGHKAAMSPEGSYREARHLAKEQVARADAQWARYPNDIKQAK